jgi:prepilin-type N-terminal cleavage/methylation domain-containing protein
MVATTGTASRGRASRAGFSLLEVMLSMSILAIAIVGTASAVLVSSKLNDRSRYEAIALEAAEDKLAQIRETAFANVATTFSGQTFTVAGLPYPTGTVVHGEVIVNDVWRREPTAREKSIAERHLASLQKRDRSGQSAS